MNDNSVSNSVVWSYLRVINFRDIFELVFIIGSDSRVAVVIVEVGVVKCGVILFVVVELS